MGTERSPARTPKSAGKSRPGTGFFSAGGPPAAAKAAFTAARCWTVFPSFLSSADSFIFFPLKDANCSSSSRISFSRPFILPANWSLRFRSSCLRRAISCTVFLSMPALLAFTTRCFIYTVLYSHCPGGYTGIY